MSNDRNQAQRLVAAAQTTLSLCSNNYTTPPGIGLCRTYDSGMHLTWNAFGKKKINHKTIRFEVACRVDGGLRERQQRTPRLMQELISKQHSGAFLPRAPFYMPADYVEKLLKVEPRHTARPCWESADFSGPVSVLASWLAALTWAPGMSLDDLHPFKDTTIIALSAIDDSAALADSAVFISQNVGCRPHSGVFWVLASAVGSCGTTVCTDRAVLVGGSTPQAVSKSGPGLWRDILDALRILGEVYDRASAGEVFAYAFFKGLHHINSVVSHSDEGGIIRDALRECRFAPPFGGLPPDCPMHGGLPTILLNAPYSALCAIVDSLSLQSAAAVAHCAPMVVNESGSGRPVVIAGCLTQEAIDGAGPPPPAKADKQVQDDYLEKYNRIAEVKTKHINMVRGPLLDSIGEFSDRYLPALAKILGFNSAAEKDIRCRCWLWDAAANLLETEDNRHLLKNSCLAPFFWIEPTTILGRDTFGYPAEQYGWASYGAGDELLKERWLDSVEEVDMAAGGWHYYEIKFEGMRKALWAICLADHKDDGLAQMHFKRINPGSLAFIGTGAGGGDPEAAWRNRANLGQYLWRRGQSKLPHPAECLHLDDWAVIAVNHYKPAEQNWLAAMPCHQEIRDAMVTAWFSAPTGCGYYKMNDEPRNVSRKRTAAIEALDWLTSRLQLPSAAGRSEGGYTMGVVRPKKMLALAGRVSVPLAQEPAGSRATETEVKRAHAPQLTSVSKVPAHPIEPVVAAGVHVGPRLPTIGPGAGGVAPVVRRGNDGQTDGIVQDGGQAAGAAADGAGAAGAAPARQ